MTKWQYLHVTAVTTDREIRRDNKGLYVYPYLYGGYGEYRKARLDPQGDWKESYKFGWAEFLALDPETGLWDRELDVLNRQGQQGWKVITTHVVKVPDGPANARFIYVLMRPID